MVSRLAGPIRWLTSGDSRFMRYLAASAVALAADAGLFMLLLAAGLVPVAAAAAGYVAGIITHWLASSRLVFADGAAPSGSNGRNIQKLLFAGSALVGIGITTTVVGVGSALGFDPRIAKLMSICLTFPTIYLLRRHVVFRG